MTLYSGPSLLAVATGIVGSAWVSGAILCFSIAGAPAAAAVPRASAQIWAELYKRGAASMPKFAAAAALSFLYAAYDAHGGGGGGGSWKILTGAAGCVLSIVPFTLVVMKGTNDALHAAAAAAAKESDVSTKKVQGLLDRWVVLNWMRGLLPLVGTGLGCVAFMRDAP